MKRYLLIKNIGRLITMTEQGDGELGVVTNASCLIKQGRVEWFGKSEDTPRIEEYLISFLDAGGGTAIPGLVDCHTHLVHGGYRQNEAAARARGKTYEEIAYEGGGIMSSVKSTRSASFEELCRSAIRRADDALLKGITTIEVKSGYGLNVETELKMLKVVDWLRINHPASFVSTFMGAHTIPVEYKENRKAYIDLIVNEMIPKVAEEKLAGYCDVFVEKIAFTVDEARQILETGKRYGLAPKLHVDQLSPCGGAELAAEMGAVSADHLDFASDEGIKKMAEKGVIAVLLPGSTFYLGGKNYAPGRKFIDSGLNVAISTDYNPGTTPALDLFLIATIASCYCKLTMEECLRGATINAAKALQLSDGQGQIKTGGVADILVLDAPDEYFPIYKYGNSCIKYVLKNGKVVHEKKG